MRRINFRDFTKIIIKKIVKQFIKKLTKKGAAIKFQMDMGMSILKYQDHLAHQNLL